MTALSLPERPRLPPHAVARPVSAVESERRDATFLGCLEEAQESLRLGDVAQSLRLARSARSIPGYERSEAALDAVGRDLHRCCRARACSPRGRRRASRATRIPCSASRSAPTAGARCRAAWTGPYGCGTSARAQLLATFEGHESTVAAVAFSADGRRAISGSWDRTLKVWDLATGAVLRTMSGHAEYVSGLALSPDGASVLSASWDQTLRLWDVASGRELGVFEGHTSNASAVAFGPDGRFAVSVGWDATVRAWDVESRRAASVLEGHTNNLGAVCLTPSGRQIASAGVDRDVRLWDLKTRRMLRQFNGHEAEVTSLAFTPDGRHLISGGRDKTVRVWDVASGKCERVLSHTAAVLAVALTPGGSTLLSAVADRTLRFWHLDWEPEERALPPWDEKARPFLESFVSLRLKPETVRTTAPWTDGEVEALVEQMRHRGFGGLQKDAVVGRLRDLALQDSPPPSFWDEVREAAPRTGPVSVGRAAPACPAEGPLEQGGSRRRARAGGGGGGRHLVPAGGRSPPGRASRRLPARAPRRLRPAALRVLLRPGGESRGSAGAGAGAEPEVSAIDLACVAQLEDGALVAPYFDRVVLVDEDKAAPAAPPPRRGRAAGGARRSRRSTRSATDSATTRPEARALAARALAESSSPRARTCLGAGALAPARRGARGGRRRRCRSRSRAARWSPGPAGR